jgi:hypothetical protein
VRYRNASNALDPPVCTPGSANGLTQLDFVDDRARGRGIRVQAKTKHSTLGTPAGPLRVTIVSGGAAEGDAGECGSHTFRPGECNARGGASLDCR